MPRTAVAPYARIAAELRGRIERGALAPGDPVPSTRAIMRRWGVAMATATKVLATLGHEGLVRAVPGVGTVVATPATTRRRPPARQAAAPARRVAAPARQVAAPAPVPLPRPAADTQARDRIVAAAIAIADAEGLAALSMRRIAVELDASTMSLYRHVDDKDDLLLHMMDAAFRAHPPGARLPGDWRARVEQIGRLMWTAFRRHPWLASAMSVTRPQLVGSGLAYTEVVLGALERLGLDAATMLTAHITLVNYIRGTAVHLELEAEAEAASGLSGDQWLAVQEPGLRALVADGGFPTFARVIDAPYDFDLDALFEFGLQRLLDGLASLAASRAGRAD